MAPLLASGCFGDSTEAGLAVPTWTTVYPPVPKPEDAPRIKYNSSDPGYNITLPWHVGDGWDWESNGTPRQFRTLRVLEAYESPNGSVVYRVEETFGAVGNRASARLTQYVDGTRWELLNATADTGTTTDFSPAKPVRFYRNATFSYNETVDDKILKVRTERSWFTYSFVEPDWSIVRLSWGQVGAFRVVHDSFSDNGAQSRVTFWVSPEHANPVRYHAGDTAWVLVAAREEGRQFGVLQPT